MDTPPIETQSPTPPSGVPGAVPVANTRRLSLRTMWGVLLFISGAILGIGGYIGYTEFIRPPNVTSFDECVKADGSHLQTSYPPTCVSRDGKSFTQDVSSDLPIDDPTADNQPQEIVEISKEEQIRGWYWGSDTQQKPGTPEHWVYTDAGKSSCWHAPDISCTNPSYACPQTEWVDCMPGPEPQKPECSNDFLQWAVINCPNFKGAAL